MLCHSFALLLASDDRRSIVVVVVVVVAVAVAVAVAAAADVGSNSAPTKPLMARPSDNH